MMRFASLGSSSRYGNAFVVNAPGRGSILLDYGVPLRRLEEGFRRLDMDPSSVKAVFITHEHTDHVGAFGIKRPFHVRYGISRFYASEGGCSTITSRYRPRAELEALRDGKGITCGPFNVKPFSKPHDCHHPLGFIIECEGERLGFATDLGHTTQRHLNLLRGCHHLIFESNYDLQMQMDSGRPPFLISRITSDLGHLSNRQAGEALRYIVKERTRTVLLAHLSLECNTPTLALNEVSNHLGANERRLPQLVAAPPRSATSWLGTEESA